jgi:lipid A disaccharide synthetase
MIIAIIVLAFIIQWYINYLILIDAWTFTRNVTRADRTFILWLSAIPIVIVIAPLIWLIERPPSDRDREVLYKKKT